MIWGAHKAEGRLAAKNATKIRAALGQQIDPKRVYDRYQETQPIKSDNLAQDRARARSWAMLNVGLNLDPVYTALVRLWTEAYVMGQLAAREAIQKTKELQKAEDKDYIDWDNWTPGDEVTAALVRPPDALQRLIEAGGSRIRGLQKETYNEIGSALGESIALGLTGKQAAKLIQGHVQSASRALTIAITETNRVSSYAAMETYKEFGLEQHEWLPINPCEICAINDGSVVNIGSPFPSGVTQPPQHPNCRCALIPVIPDMSEQPNENGVVDIAPEQVNSSTEISEDFQYNINPEFRNNGIAVTNEQSVALASYRGNGYGSYTDINKYLRDSYPYGTRKPDEILEKVIKERVQELDKLMAIAPATPTNFISYRGVQGGYADVLRDLAPGQTFTDLGFSSTTLSREVAEKMGYEYAGSTIIEITNPAGTRGIMMKGFFNTDANKEFEWLLPRRTTFEVVSKTEINGITVIKVVVE